MAKSTTETENIEYYTYILGNNCRCGKAKLTGCVWCNECWVKLPLYMQNILNDSMAAMATHILHGMKHLGLK